MNAASSAPGRQTEHRKAGAAGRPLQCEPMGPTPAKDYFNQPRFLKYHIGTSALATISTNANG